MGLGTHVLKTSLLKWCGQKIIFVVFIIEAWADEARLNNVKRKIQFKNMFVVPRTSRGGGLVLFWRSSIAVTVEGSDKNHIDAIINKDIEDEWRFTGFYGEPETFRRIESWNLLRSLNQNKKGGYPIWCKFPG